MKGTYSMRPTILEGFLLLALISGCPYVSPSFCVVAQVQNTSVTGVVRDQENSAISKAMVSVFDEKQTLVISTSTNEEGLFMIYQ
ncbi:MAG: hypothetical protein FD167_6135 [bacterium]|nr:MAG: hypothetical protein FD167_6135 [bacterium]